MSDVFDPSVPEHAKALRLLDEQLIAWFTTIGSDGAPRAVPVWFVFHDGVITVLSQPDTVKVHNVERDPRVVVNLATGQFGDDVVVVRGTATLRPDGAADWLERHHDTYVAKYAAAIEDYGTPLEEFSKTFTTVIEVTPEHLLAW